LVPAAAVAAAAAAVCLTFKCLHAWLKTGGTERPRRRRRRRGGRDLSFHLRWRVDREKRAFLCQKPNLARTEEVS